MKVGLLGVVGVVASVCVPLVENQGQLLTLGQGLYVVGGRVGWWWPVLVGQSGSQSAVY